MSSNSTALIVPPTAPEAATNDIRGLKPPVDLPNSWFWMGWTLALLVLAALAAWVWRKWRKQTPQFEMPPRVPPHVRARQQLLLALDLLSNPREFCILVSDTIRVYLEERFEFRAPERTTEEFLVELQDTLLLTPDQKQSLGGFLQSCDLVKFARFEPTESVLRELHDSAARLIDETQFESLGISVPASTSLRPLQSGPNQAGNRSQDHPNIRVT